MTDKHSETWGKYSDDRLSHVAFPMGGMGAGMICLEGNGGFSHVSLRHKPDVFNEPMMFAALRVDGAPTARVLEGPVPMRKAFGAPGTGNGFQGGRHHGLPRFSQASFTSRFPFGQVTLRDRSIPVKVDITGWSPFAPGDADSACLPVAGLEYRLVNGTSRRVTGMFSFHAANFMRPADGRIGEVTPMTGGFVLSDRSHCELSPFVAGWQVSKLFPSAGSIADAPVARLADRIDWQPATMEGWFASVFSRHGRVNGFTYLGTRLRVAQAGRWLFSIGHDGGIRMFVDGQPVMACVDRQHPLREGRQKIDVDLSAGTHEVVFACELNGQGWGVSLAFGVSADTPATGEPKYPEPPAWAARAASRGSFAAFAADPRAVSDCAWFRGGWFDPLTVLWQRVESGVARRRPPHREGGAGDGGSLYVPVSVPARGAATVRVLLAWHVPESGLTAGVKCCHGACSEGGQTSYVPWYVSRFADVGAVARHWRKHYASLKAASLAFSECFYDTTLPAEVVDAVAANLTILKSPTVLRQHDGRLWGWEGCCDSAGCCYGSCTHVWNYAQALPHLFPGLERTLRETEFLVSQDERGHQNFRTNLPIGPSTHDFHAAADGQLGGIMKVFRDWRVSGDTEWMRRLWPHVKRSLDYCIDTWDPHRKGVLEEPHHNTYDIEFWGADGMCMSFYLGALRAAVEMGEACGDDMARYRELTIKCRQVTEGRLWNGRYFFQRVQWKGLRAASPQRAMSAATSYSPEAVALMRNEGPKYQYGKGCLSDGVLGDWMARVCGVGPVLAERKVGRHLRSVFAHNFKPSLAGHANPQRPGYAFGQEGGLVLCTWPNGGKPALPFVYSDEVWTGIEYQAAAHLIMLGHVEEGLDIVRAVRRRYDGRFRNPFNEYECGHWYARAMASYSLLQALSGARYDAVEKTLYLEPAVKGDFRAFLCTATGYGAVGVRKGRPFVSVAAGRIDVETIRYQPCRRRT